MIHQYILAAVPLLALLVGNAIMPTGTPWFYRWKSSVWLVILAGITMFVAPAAGWGLLPALFVGCISIGWLWFQWDTRKQIEALRRSAGVANARNSND